MLELWSWPSEWVRPRGSNLKQRFVFFASQNFLLQGQPEVPIKVIVWETSAIVKYFSGKSGVVNAGWYF